jgi:flagellum-specific peptidoglycan hydrolase FlgJ
MSSKEDVAAAQAAAKKDRDASREKRAEDSKAKRAEMISKLEALRKKSEEAAGADAVLSGAIKEKRDSAKASIESRRQEFLDRIEKIRAAMKEKKESKIPIQ